MGGPYKFLSELGLCAFGAGALFLQKNGWEKTCEFFQTFSLNAYPAII